MSERDSYLKGVLAGLGFVYAADAETLAEEIVSAVGPYALLRIAEINEDCYLPNLRRTIRFLERRKNALAAYRKGQPCP